MIDEIKVQAKFSLSDRIRILLSRGKVDMVFKSPKILINGKQKESVGGEE